MVGNGNLLSDVLNVVCNALVDGPSLLLINFGIQLSAPLFRPCLFAMFGAITNQMETCESITI